jgi:hypothetical protein
MFIISPRAKTEVGKPYLDRARIVLLLGSLRQWKVIRRKGLL